MIATLGAGCARQPLLERAIEARGGRTRGLVIRSEARVYAGVPGIWESTRIWLAPDHYAWTITTAADPIVQLFDGTTARSFVGTAEVAREAGPYTPLRSHARWTAVANLQGLEEPGVVLAPLAAADLPDGVREGLSVEFPDGARYRLGFDDRTLLVWLQGPLDLAPFASGDVTARFADHRRVGRLRLPFATAYTLAGMPIADESVRAICADPPGLTADAFADPTTLPACP